MTDLTQGTLFFIAALALVLAGLVLYLCLLLARVETVLLKVIRALRSPQVPRDRDGRALYERD